MRWSTRADVVTKLSRRWDDGEFLSRFAEGAEWLPLSVRLRTPTARDLADRFSDVQVWVDRWQRTDDRGLRIETTEVGGGVVGRNDIPHRACVDTYEQLWSLLGVTREVRRFSDLLEATKARAPRIAEFMVSSPMEVLAFADEWSKLLDTVLWIESHATHPMYLRQVDVPGVDTKFIEGHRRILASLLDWHLPEERIDRAWPPSEFARRFGFLTKPEYVRFRHLDAPSGFTEMTVRTNEFAGAVPNVTTVFVVENEITYLAFPPLARSILIFGGGYALSRLEPLTWLAEKELIYWGDIDTHGFTMLNRLRRRFGHVRSMLMDRATLLVHESQWVREPSPVNTYLELLNPDEAALYTDLVEHTLGEAVRLEQERVNFGAIERALRSSRLPTPVNDG